MLSIDLYDYDLPDELIAQHPAENRTESRLLKVDQGREHIDASLRDIVSEFRAGDLLVLNNTRVIPARVLARKESGGKAEIMLERLLENGHALVQMRASRAAKVGSVLLADQDPQTKIKVIARHDTFFEIRIESKLEILEWFKAFGQIPLPPYIERPEDSADEHRYQTVYARRDGAVAAPTAGLHFDRALLEQIQNLGVTVAEVTLHVGAGTYQPVRVDSISEHKMHREWIEVGAEVCNKINATRASGGKVFAVGTTVVRALESAAAASEDDTLIPFTGDTEIFIYPGFEFKVVDRLLTNFHLPKSTLLMLVSAFSGRDTILHAYQHAVQKRYRFFSYGDCMLLHRAGT